MNSLQTRLLIGVMSVFAVGFLLASVAIYMFSRATMYAEFDAALFATAQALASLTEQTEDGVEFELSDGFEEFSRNDAPSYYQFWLDGKAFARSQHLQNRDLEFGQGTFESPKFRYTELPDGRPGRQVCVAFQPNVDWDDGNDIGDEDDDERYRFDSRNESARPLSTQHVSVVPDTSGIVTLTWELPESNVTIAVARATTEIDRRLASLLWILPLVGTAITLLSSFVLVRVVRSGLKPVEEISSAIVGIDENSLADRVPTDRVPVEISPMIGRLNQLLSRLENAFHRERTFSSNLAHELRTPLAGLRATLEVYRTKGHDEQRCDRAISTCLEICDQSETLVENLLALARVEGPKFARRMEEVQVDVLSRECWELFADRAREKNLKASLEFADFSVKTDREVLRVILQNLLSNAVCHSDKNGTLDVIVRPMKEQFLISVCNTGNQLTEQQAELAFDRLWRGDSARSETGEHFGLGLTIIKRFTEALGGNVKLSVDQAFCITVSIPI